MGATVSVIGKGEEIAPLITTPTSRTALEAALIVETSPIGNIPAQPRSFSTGSEVAATSVGSKSVPQQRIPSTPHPATGKMKKMMLRTGAGGTGGDGGTC